MTTTFTRDQRAVAEACSKSLDGTTLRTMKGKTTTEQSGEACLAIIVVAMRFAASALPLEKRQAFFQLCGFPRRQASEMVPESIKFEPAANLPASPNTH